MQIVKNGGYNYLVSLATFFRYHIDPFTRSEVEVSQSESVKLSTTNSPKYMSYLPLYPSPKELPSLTQPCNTIKRIWVLVNCKKLMNCWVSVLRVSDQILANSIAQNRNHRIFRDDHSFTKQLIDKLTGKDVYIQPIS